MRGYINEQGKFVKPCKTCEYKDYHYGENPCAKCVDIMDIILKTRDVEKDFRNYTPQCS